MGLLSAIENLGVRFFGPLFVAGRSVEEVLAKGEELKKQGFFVTYNLLGEHAADLGAVLRAENTMHELLAKMTNANRGNISLKPTLYGLQLSQLLCRRVAGRLVTRAKIAGVETEFDAEAYEFIPATFEVFSSFASDFRYREFVRQAVQAHLRDIVPLMDKYQLWDKHLRVVKGSNMYKEDPAVVADSKTEMLKQYYALVSGNIFRSQTPYIATICDKEMAENIKKKLGTPYLSEFQMLYGPLGRKLRKDLLARGWRVRVYLPFVAPWCRDAWKDYCRRRAGMMRKMINPLR